MSHKTHVDQALRKCALSKSAETAATARLRLRAARECRAKRLIIDHTFGDVGRTAKQAAGCPRPKKAVSEERNNRAWFRGVKLRVPTERDPDLFIFIFIFC